MTGLRGIHFVGAHHKFIVQYLPSESGLIIYDGWLNRSLFGYLDKNKIAGVWKLKQKNIDYVKEM